MKATIVILALAVASSLVSYTKQEVQGKPVSAFARNSQVPGKTQTRQAPHYPAVFIVDQAGIVRAAYVSENHSTN